MNILDNDWQLLLEEEFNKDYYKKLRTFLVNEYNTSVVYPNMHDIYNALNFTPYKKVKIVILGQDPYHGKNQAHGLSFSVQPGVKIPPSLKNIYKELNLDLGCYIPNHGHLTKWAKQGVLLLNTALTVRENNPSSHSKIGWEKLTDKIITLLNRRTEPVIFILWGNYAKSKEVLIINKNHNVIKSAHPSPFSASKGFFNSKPFSRANLLLTKLGKEPIDWQIENTD